jgi:3-hydroxyacyl-CoA dehydrogenase/enoyl-CoA hydratase/3-hydroxybutyryl-CoA epimerase
MWRRTAWDADEGVGMEALGVDKPAAGLRVRLEDGIARLEFGVPGSHLNTLTAKFVTDLERLFESLLADSRVLGIVLASGKPDVFCAGVDLGELAALRNPAQAAAASRLGQRVFARFESSPKPVVAAVHGACVGGGCEMVLACHWRVFADDPSTRIGLPEVKLGIIPGFGGTQRLPRIAGLETALQLLLTGEMLDARRALRAGLADELVYPELVVEAAHAAAQRLAASGQFVAARSPRQSRLSLRGLRERTALGRALVLRASEKRVSAATGGHYPAPLAALAAVRAGLENGGHAFDREAELLGDLATGDVAKHLVHLFQLGQEARSASVELPPVRRVHELALVGTGLMGAGIAAQAVQHDIDVHMEDTGIEPLLGAFRHVRGVLREQVQRGRLDRHELDEQMKRLSASLDGTGVEGAEVVIEAVVEDLTVKQGVLAGIESRVRDDCVLASNTSSLSIAALAAGLQHPERCVGMHFFNPVHRMPLVEIVVTPRTDPKALARALALARQMGKTPLVVRDAPGFLVNRILGRYLDESARLFGAGWDAEALDRLLRHFGMPLGPFELLDENGIDVADAVGRVLHAGLGERFRPAPLVSVLRGAGRLGRKRGRGMYRYGSRGGHERQPDREFWRTIGPDARSAATLREEDALDRVLFGMVDEAARCLEEGIVASPGEVDLALVTGTGFPPFRGGLLQYADERGLPALLGRLRGFETELGPRFSPSERLIRMAAHRESFFAATQDVPAAGSPA